MSMPNPADLASWRVTGQTELTQVQPGGTPVRGVQVFYSTAAGHNGSVFIPYSQYTPEFVAAAVGDAAGRMDAIGQLSGGPVQP